MNTISNAAYEGDIVSRLRNWRGRHLAHCGQLFEDAADEIERLRNGSLSAAETNERSVASTGSRPVAWAVMQPDSYSVFASRMLAEKMQELCAGGEIVPLYRQPQPTLTADVREAVAYFATFHGSPREADAKHAATLRALLERMK